MGHFNLIANYFAEIGFIFVKLNLSHNGTTPEHSQDFVDQEAFGNNNFSIELDDIGVLVDYLFSNPSELSDVPMDSVKLFTMGRSRGGGLVYVDRPIPVSLT